jgi:hypothetical protein
MAMAEVETLSITRRPISTLSHATTSSLVDLTMATTVVAEVAAEVATTTMAVTLTAIPSHHPAGNLLPVL